MNRDDLIKRISTELYATAEVYGRRLSEAAFRMMVSDLDNYPPEAVLKAIERCRAELRTFPSVADITSRIDDGHPGVEEAWTMIPKDEAGSVVWTEEMAIAFGPVIELLDRDLIGARMAFKEMYTKLVADAKANKRLPKWSPSFGFEPTGRARALKVAIEKGRITQDRAVELLPDLGISPEDHDSEITQIIRQALPLMPDRESSR